LKAFDVIKKAFDITLGAIADLDEAIDLLKLEMTISDSDKNEELQKIISLLGGASKSLVESITVFGKYVNL
jgi:hypothetical protein